MKLSPRARRRWIILLGLLALLGSAGLFIHRQLQPERFAALVLNQVGSSQGLQLSINGMPDYALRPEPRLRLPDFTARLPGGGPVLLQARQLELSLPWATLIDADAALVITRISLDEPVLDLAVLRQWLASQPSTPFELPTLTHGLHIHDGRLRDTDWSLGGLSLELASLQPNKPANLVTRGVMHSGEHQVSFDGEAGVSSVSPAFELTLSFQGNWQQGERVLPYRIAGAMHVLAENKPIALKGSVQGELAAWPSDWPALPAPVSQSGSPLLVRADYAGSTDFTDNVTVRVQRDDTTLSADVNWPRLQAWLNDPAAAVLPPLAFTVQSPRIELGDAVMEGVTIELQDTATATP